MTTDRPAVPEGVMDWIKYDMVIGIHRIVQPNIGRVARFEDEDARDYCLWAAQSIAALAEIERADWHETACIRERDHRTEQISKIYAILDGGDEGHEWGIHHDLGDEAIDLAIRLNQERDAALAMVKEMRMVLSNWLAHRDAMMAGVGTTKTGLEIIKVASRARALLERTK